MTFVLRKSFGAYSAGTEVYPTENGYFYVRGNSMQSITVPSELVVKRRSMTVMRPNTTTSRQRRKDNKRAKQLVLGIANKQ